MANSCNLLAVTNHAAVVRRTCPTQQLMMRCTKQSSFRGVLRYKVLLVGGAQVDQVAGAGLRGCYATTQHGVQAGATKAELRSWLRIMVTPL